MVGPGSAKGSRPANTNYGSEFWLWAFFVLMPTAAVEKIVKCLSNKSADFPDRYNRLKITISSQRIKLGWLAAAIWVFWFYRHSVIPYCDPWRDNSVGVVSGFPLSGVVSSVLLLPCGQAGAARESAINSLVQYNHLSNISEAFSEHKIDYDHLFWLSETAKIASDSLINKRRKREGDMEYHGVLDLQYSLNKVGPFVLDFLQLRKVALGEMKHGLSVYNSQLEHEKEAWRWSKQTELSVGKGIEEVMVRRWIAKIKYEKALSDISNRTLDAVKHKADELYGKLEEGKEMFENIGHYFVLNRYLNNAQKSTHEQRTRDMYERLGGKREELDGYAKVVRNLDYPALELAIDDYLLQFRQAKKLLNAAIDAYGTDKMASVYPPFPPSKEDMKVRLTLEFDLRRKKIASLAKDLEDEKAKTERVLDKIDVLLASRFGWKV
jgi:hypothetical protein